MGERYMTTEIQVLLVGTIIIGVILMLALICCYACVLRRICLGSPRERRARKASANRSESIPMADYIRHSQATESERV